MEDNKGLKKYRMETAMRTYYRYIKNAEQRLGGLLETAKDAVNRKDFTRIGQTKKNIDELRDEMKTIYEELEILRSKYIELYGEPAV